jgi:type IV pilus assembly protein PilA
MKTEFKAKLISHLIQRKKNQGFTLIELLVVVIIIGVLAAVALPNLLSQVGKARESEAKTGVGSVNRAQQAYHFERQSFGASADNLGVTLPSTYYKFTIAGNSKTDGSVTAVDANANQNGTRDYAGAINFAAATGTYKTVVCQGTSVGSGVPTGDAVAGTCAGGVALQ